ncbi:hypothetical protein PIB30_085401 [Stylosanthes scabra]|uniref:Uncharacterized protein n=1 Tax=Stylosanthes scabra TaxID=79078 RepID=A0ABU6STR4_9FABA|nr:hypothetical protein [Stylosanthes scabra]
MCLEVQIARKQKKSLGQGMLGSKLDLCLDDGSDSTRSCPFPPGFGPCVDHAYLHRDLARAHKGDRCVSVVPVTVVEGVSDLVEVDNTCALPERVEEAVAAGMSSDECVWRLIEWRNRDESDAIEDVGTGVVVSLPEDMNEVVQGTQGRVSGNELLSNLKVVGDVENQVREGETEADDTLGVSTQWVCDIALAEGGKIQGLESDLSEESSEEDSFFEAA